MALRAGQQRRERLAKLPLPMKRQDRVSQLGPELRLD
jgi:hypothetical protein